LTAEHPLASANIIESQQTTTNTRKKRNHNIYSIGKKEVMPLSEDKLFKDACGLRCLEHSRVDL